MNAVAANNPAFVIGNKTNAAVVNDMPTVPMFNSTVNVTERTAIPTTGTWAVGDRIYNSAPEASGFIGWVCTVAGTPGTWKTFGAISA